jgi:spermidine synthase
VGLLIGGGLLALLTVPLVRWLGPGARGDGDLAALAITVVALVPPAAVLSAVSPAIAHLQLHDLRSSGTVVGRLSAWATAGALVGTFGAGFVLVPLMPVSTAVLGVGALLVMVGIALGATSRRVSPVVAASAAVMALALAALSAALDSPCDAETSYHCASVEADVARPAGYHLLLDDLHHSYVDLDDPTHLEYSYVKWIADAIDATSGPREPLNAVFVGGGGFTLPRWLTATRPGSRAHVLEVDGGLVDFVEDRLGLRTSPELSVTVGDARVSMLDVADGSADLVVGDAFGHLAVPWHLTTAEWTREVRRVLKPGGLYALNVIDLRPLKLFEAELATVRDTFPYVRVIATPGDDERPAGGNSVILASARPLPPEAASTAEGAVTYVGQAVRRLAGDAQVLRDDDAPVDQLLTTDGVD